ncbi:hypothetical protein [Nocardia pseudobrasiliensis]|uniref:Uncharacterized protein n=1 Tax=Nocardia pseudobrasiliensis TaxID=45979 RepID=A0A370HXK1_9NOCA|nr:hypothetical protein [Nocardia pseudobrasiliensis]RDI63217.1 hypothetical protein DFR76_111236 [Nocardia pseudobrasiliensis]
MSVSDETISLPASFAIDMSALLARVVTLRADLDALANLVQGMALAVDAGRPASTAGSLSAIVSLGPQPEAV